MHSLKVSRAFSFSEGENEHFQSDLIAIIMKYFIKFSKIQK